MRIQKGLAETRGPTSQLMVQGWCLAARPRLVDCCCSTPCMPTKMKPRIKFGCNLAASYQRPVQLQTYWEVCRTRTASANGPPQPPQLHAGMPQAGTNHTTTQHHSINTGADAA